MVRIVVTCRLGLTRGRVELAGSDPGWQSAFSQIAAELRLALADTGAAIEHVGSTAVPGLAAKPIIDIAIGVHGDVGIDRIIRLLEPFGWIYRGDAAMRAATCSRSMTSRIIASPIFTW